MKNNKDDKAINAGEQTPEVLLRNIQILDKEVIEFSVENMVIAEPGVIKEMDISFEPDENKYAIGSIKPKVLDEENVMQSFSKIDKTVNILSLLYGVRDWTPKMFRIETSATRIMKPQDLIRVDDAFKLISARMNNEESEVYFRALEWYRHGINSKTQFNSFLAFYNAIELVSDGYIYKKHKSEIKKSKTEKDKCIKEYFENESIMSISKIERKHINDCYVNCLQTSAEDKMRFAFKTVFDRNEEKMNEFLKKFFERKGENEEKDNFKSIRDKIAHGDLSEYREADRTLVKNNLFEIQDMAKEFLTKIIS